MRHRALLPLLLCACNRGEESLICTASVDEDVATVINLSWEAPEGGSSWVEFGTGGVQDLSTTVQEKASVSFPLVGVPADTEVSWTGITEVDGERSTCTGTTTTDTLPADLPQVVINIASDGQSASPRFLLGAYYDLFSASYVVGMDRLGNIVWYAPRDEDGIAIQAEMSADGRGVYYNHFGKDLDVDEGKIRHVSFGGELLDERRTPLAHHMFTQLPDGNLAYQQLITQTVTNPETGEVEDWVGDGVAEVDADGNVTQVFSVWDWLTPTWNDKMGGFSLYGDPDWTHGNGLKYDADTNQYLLSLGHAADVIEFDRSTGEPTRIFGNDGMTEEDGEAFYYQHDPTLLDDNHLLMFCTDHESDLTGAREYAIDDEAGTLTEVWRYQSEITSIYLGQARRLSSGNTLLTFGQGATMREVTPEGEVVWELVTVDRVGLAQFQLLDNFYEVP